MSLSETQSRAVAHGAGPCICLAGPGSGKTTVITERTKYLIEKQGISPSEILVITFTKAASIEMRERFHNAMKGRYAPVTFGTFHAVFFTILKAAYHYTAENILREEEKYTILRDILEPMDLEIEDEKEFLLGVTEEISLIKNERISLEHYYSSNCPEDVFRSIFREYQQALIRKRKLDFDDMLVCTYELLKARPDICRGWQKRFRYILIDEFQDINAIQYETVKLLAQPGNNLFIVGDDDQSIYRFRGAKPEIMLNFQKDFPKAVMIQLAENYRSTECIIKGAGRVIAHNTNRFQKSTHGIRGNGEKITISFFQNQAMEALAVVKKSAGYAARRKRAAGDRSSVPDEYRSTYLSGKIHGIQPPVSDAGRTAEYLRTLDRKRSVYLHTHCKRKSQPERFSADHKPSEPLYQP